MASDRTVRVQLKADVSEYTASLARAAEQTRGLGDESRKTQNDTKGVGDESNKASAALRKLSDAAGNAQLAQLRLNEARERGKSSASTMLALTQRLERAQRDLGSAQSDAVKVTRDNDLVQRTLAESMARAVRSSAVQAEVNRSGEDAGGTLARGINQGLVRNSPLIVAGIGGALAAGAPVAIAGATALFGGIGIAAAASSSQVKSAWSKTWDSITTGAQADASVLQGTLVDMAGQIERGFSSLRPALRLMFADAAPLLDQFTGSLVNAAQNAMPGLVDAVHAAAPVFDGLGSLVEDIGTGLSDFFEAISQHSQAAGTAFEAIGQIIQEMLPILGDLLGQGAELASTVLPPLADALGVIGDALHVIAPILPEIALGFAAFKIVGALSGPLDLLSAKLQTVAADGEGMTTAIAGRAAGAVSKMSSALPFVGIALGLVGAAFEESKQQINDWGNAILQGGAAADKAIQSAEATKNAWDLLSNTPLLSAPTAVIEPFANAMGVGANAVDSAKQKADELYHAMSPLQQAQTDVSAATNDLTQKVKDYHANSPEAISASYALRDAQANLAYQEDLTKGSIDGVTQAMIDQYNQALSATNSSFAYRDAQNSVADAQTNLTDVQSHLNDTNEATRTTTDDVSRAGLQLEEALLRQATAAGQLASDALPATATELDKNTASAQGTLQELYKMRDQMGSAFPASLQQTISNLEQTGVHLDTTTGQAQNLGDTVNGIPTLHSIHVDADLGPAQAKMDSFITKHWTAIISTNVVGSGSGGAGGTRGAFKVATGGPIIGPGTGTSDDVPLMGSNGEHMWTAREVQAAGGHNAVKRLRNAVLAGRVQRLADGGPVSKDWSSVLVDADMSGAAAAMTAAQRAAGSAIGGSLAGVQTTGPIQDIVRSVANQFGWGSGAQWNALAALIQHESGWRPNAQNPTSTAYGLGQFLNSTWASVGGHKTSDPSLQALYMDRYIQRSYGSPSNAWAKWQSRSPHWYADGGVIGEPVIGVGMRSGDSYSFGERGPEMVTPMSREISGGGYGGAGAVKVPTHFTGDLYLDSGEFLGKVRGMARVEAEGVVGDYAQAVYNRGAYN